LVRQHLAHLGNDRRGQRIGGADFALHIGARQPLDLNLRLVGLSQEIAVLHHRHEGAAQCTAPPESREVQYRVGRDAWS
jgi:hypothetical protein